MIRTFTCSICDSEFKNSRSLYSHKYKYHPKSLRPSTNQEVKRNKEDEHGHNDYDARKNIVKHYNKSLSKYTKRLPKLFRIVGDILDDVKELKEAASDNIIHSISPLSSLSISPASSINPFPVSGEEEIKDIKSRIHL